MMIGWADFVAGTAEIITKLAFYIRFDFHLAVAGAGEENRRSDSLCALDSLRMIMCYLGGDSDTLAAITGSIAEAFYGVPENLKQECRKRLTPDLEEILQACENMILQR